MRSLLLLALLALLLLPAAGAEPAPLTPELEAEARSYGLASETAQALLAEPGVVETLRTVPEEVGRDYATFSLGQRRVAYLELCGVTRVGFVQVDHRKAFIEGRVMGEDIFPHVKRRFDRHVRDGGLTREEGERLKALMDLLAVLTPGQREAIARVIELEGDR